MRAAWLLLLPIAVICLGLWDIRRTERRCEWARETHVPMEGEE